MLRLASNVAGILTKPERAPGLPVYLHVEPTNRCHLTCIGCSRDVTVTEESDLPLDVFKRLIDEVKPSWLALNGIGEPLLHPQFFDMVKYARSHGARVNTCSSMVLPTAAFAGIVECGLDFLKVSIDGATKKTYTILRGRDLFDRVIDGVRAVQAEKKRLGTDRPALRFQCLLVEETLAELEDVLALAADLGVEACNFQPLETSNVEARMHPHFERLEYDAVLATLERAQARASRLGIASNLGDLVARFPVFWGKYRPDDPRAGTDTTVCPMPWYSVYVNASGVVQPCCKFPRYGETHGALGNVKEAGLLPIWNGARLRELRGEFKRGERTKTICQECVANGPFEMLGRIKMLKRFSTPATGLTRVAG